MIELAQQPTRAPKDTDKVMTKAETKHLQQKLFDLQRQLYAHGKHSLLLIFQGVDTAGKDSTVRTVFSGINPMGCRVTSFKQPTPLELSHDFLWRVWPHFPPKGHIHIFNRSYYEDLLIPHLNNSLPDAIWDQRCTLINTVEQHLHHSHTTVLKFFLHISAQEQQKRLEERLNDPRKRWKYHPADAKAPEQYPHLYKAYEDVFEKTQAVSPWHVIPADQKWYRNYRVAQVVVAALEGLYMHGYPEPQH